MEYLPFEGIVGVPSGQNTLVEIRKDNDFIDIADSFTLQTVRGIRKSYYTGLTAFMFNSQLKFGFNKEYNLIDVEFRRPFAFSQTSELIYEGVNLFQPSLVEVREALLGIGVSTHEIDVGLEANDLGLSFFSSEYEKDLSVKLDAVTVNF